MSIERDLEGWTIAFDLDGTLVDSAPDLIGTLNRMLAQYELPPVPMSSARHLVGHGAMALLRHGFMEAGAAWDEAAMAGANDPGVRSVREIYQYYKRFGITTEVMGASFRNVGQIVALAGCDLLTIAPELLAQLEASTAPVLPALDAQAARQLDIAPVHYDEASFRFALNEDAMATEKLAEGIRAFAVDTRKLEDLLRQAGAGA